MDDKKEDIINAKVSFLKKKFARNVSFMKILHLGCGIKKIKGAVGVDIHPDTKADIIHDLNKFPYPFNDSEFDMIICDSILEHLDDIIKIIEEIYRIAKAGALVKIVIPHFSSDDAFTDVTHKHFFSSRSFDIFTPDKSPFPFYSKAKFRIVKSRINFGRIYKLLGIEFIANKVPLFYETHFAFIFQAHNIYLELKVIK